MFTEAYVDLMFACGHARLGDVSQTQRLIDEAKRFAEPDLTSRIGPLAKRVRIWFYDAFTYRIEQATTDRPHDGPLPSDLVSRLESEEDRSSLEPCSFRYVVDNVRYISRILEPPELIDPYAPWKKYVSAPVAEDQDPGLVFSRRSSIAEVTDLSRARTDLDKILANRAAPLFERSRAIIDFIAVLGRHRWSERAAGLLQLIERLPRFRNAFSTRDHYSRTHLLIVDRMVMALACEVGDATGSSYSSSPADEFPARREALLEARAKLLVWGRTDWGSPDRST